MEARAKAAWIALVLAIAVRLVLGLAAIDLPPLSDGGHFDRIARALLEGRGFGESPGYRTAHRPPLQAGWLALLYALLGSGWHAGVLGGALAGGLLAATSAWIAGRLSGHASAALLAGGGVALYPRLVDVYVRQWSLSEGLFTTLLVAALGLWLAAESGPIRRALGAGGALGLATLTRPVSLLLPLVLLDRCRGRGGRVGLALTGFVLVLTPWTLRNYRMYHVFVPVSTMAGIVFYQGFHPPAGGWGSTPWAEIHRLTAGLPDEPAVSSYLIHETVATIVSDPVAALRLLPVKLAWLVSPFSEVDGRVDPVFLAALGLGLLGAVGWRRPGPARVVLWALLYFPAMALVFYGSTRFRLPIEPLLLIAGASWLGQEGRLRCRRVRLSIMLAVSGLLVLSACPGLEASRLLALLGAR